MTAMFSARSTGVSNPSAPSGSPAITKSAAIQMPIAISSQRNGQRRRRTPRSGQPRRRATAPKIAPTTAAMTTASTIATTTETSSRDHGVLVTSSQSAAMSTTAPVLRRRGTGRLPDRPTWRPARP